MNTDYEVIKRSLRRSIIKGTAYIKDSEEIGNINQGTYDFWKQELPKLKDIYSRLGGSVNEY